MRNLIKSFGLSEAGQVGLMMGLLSTPVILAVGGAVDYARAMEVRKSIQTALDISTVAAAKDEGDEASRKAIGRAMFKANFGKSCTSNPKFKFNDDVIEGSVTCAVETSILQVVGFSTIDISADSEVTLEGGPPPKNILTNACVIGLNKTVRHAVNIAGSGKVDFECGVYSRSNNTSAMHVHKSGDFFAPTVSTVGGYAVNSNGKVETVFHTGAPVVDDPLKNLPIPDEALGGCDHVAKSYNTATPITLTPGIYCNGLKINSSSSVYFQPGVYVFRNGDLTYSASGNLTALNVMLYFEGSSDFYISASGNVKFTGLQSGDHAGLAIAQSNGLLDGPTSMMFNMSGNSFVEGTIYLPRSHLTMGMSGDTYIKPGYTAYIADRLSMNASGGWTVGSDYESGTPLPLLFDEAMKVVPQEKTARISH